LFTFGIKTEVSHTSHELLFLFLLSKDWKMTVVLLGKNDLMYTGLTKSQTYKKKKDRNCEQQGKQER
jgi:hypothetical protein